MNRPMLLVTLALSGCLPLPDDADGDGLTELDGDCDDHDRDVKGTITVFTDGDGDGFGADGTDQVVTCATGVPAGLVPKGGDCNDGNASTNPDATEICSADDDDCNGLVDDEDPGVDPASMEDWWADGDGDRYGAGDVVQRSCAAPEGTVRKDPYTPAEDCDDAHAEVNADAPEICDGLDNNCDTVADEGVKETVYNDLDLDGYGGEPSFEGCPSFATTNQGGDCDDDLPGVHPDAQEVCDGIDNNCTPEVDEADSGWAAWTGYETWPDGDGDRWGENVPQGSQSCSLPAGYAFVTNHWDCDDQNAATSHDRVVYVSIEDSDNYAAHDSSVPACDQDPINGESAFFGDCDLTDGTRWLPVDACNDGLPNYCGAPEVDCESTETVSVGQWTTNLGAWSPHLGDFDGDGQVDVVLGTFDVAYEAPSPLDRPDTVRLLTTTVLDPSSSAWSVSQTIYQLPMVVGEPGNNLGFTQAAIGNFDGTRDGELVIVDHDANNEYSGAVPERVPTLWFVSNPPPGVNDEVEVVRTGQVQVPYRMALQRQFGYALTAGDLDRDGFDEVIVSAPTFGYDSDLVVIVPGTSDQEQITTLDAPAVVELEDGSVYADGLGVEVAFTGAFAPDQTALAVTALGSRSDRGAVLVFRGEDLADDGELSSLAVNWYTTALTPPSSHWRHPGATWGELGRQSDEADLVFTATDDVHARAYLFYDVASHPRDRVSAEAGADLVLDLPFADCIEPAVVAGRIVLACSDDSAERGFQDNGFVFLIDPAQFVGPGPFAITSANSTQLRTVAGGAYNASRPVVTRFDADTELLVLDYFAGWAFDGFSWLPVDAP